MAFFLLRGWIDKTVEAYRAGSKKIGLFGKLFLCGLVHFSTLLDFVHKLVLLACLRALVDLRARAVDRNGEPLALVVKNWGVVAPDEIHSGRIGCSKRGNVKHGRLILLVGEKYAAAGRPINIELQASVCGN
jgi:hypothetical protein